MSKQVLKSELYQRCRKDLSLLRQMSFGGLPFLAGSLTEKSRSTKSFSLASNLLAIGKHLRN